MKIKCGCGFVGRLRDGYPGSTVKCGKCGRELPVPAFTQDDPAELVADAAKEPARFLMGCALVPVVILLGYWIITKIAG